MLTEAALPIILILILGFLLWRLTQPKWINRVFASFVYKRNPFVKEFFGQIAQVVDEKGKKIWKKGSWFVYLLCLAIILVSFLPYFPYQDHTVKLFLKEGLPKMFLHLGMIFIGYAVSLSVTSTFLFVKEMKKCKVSNRGMEIYLLGKYLENISYLISGLTLVIGGIYLWFYFLEKLLPVFSYLENQFVSYSALKGRFGEMLMVLRLIFVDFKNGFQNWCILGLLTVFVGFAMPYMWFKGKGFTVKFLAIFLFGTALSYIISVTIRKFVSSELTLIFMIVWIFSALITYIIFHLIKSISLSGVAVCQLCQTENSTDSKYCKNCGSELIVFPKT